MGWAHVQQSPQKLSFKPQTVKMRFRGLNYRNDESIGRMAIAATLRNICSLENLFIFKATYLIYRMNVIRLC